MTMEALGDTTLDSCKEHHCSPHCGSGMQLEISYIVYCLVMKW